MVSLYKLDRSLIWALAGPQPLLTEVDMPTTENDLYFCRWTS
jgi:hypothetical protein